MSNLKDSIRKQFRHQEIAFVMFVAAFALFKFPLQHHITLSRFQHYGICLYIWSLGFFLQTVWSWKKLTARGRACLLCTGVYVGSFAIIFYQNPWLDARMAVASQEQDLQRLMFILLCGLLGFLVSIFWLAWVLEQKQDAQKLEAQKETAI